MNKSEKGLECPHCGHTSNKCVETRVHPRGASTRRRRECQQCGQRFTTREKVVNEDDKMIVVSGQLVCSQQIEKTFDEALVKLSEVGNLLKAWREFNNEAYGYRRDAAVDLVLDELRREAREAQP